MRKEPGSVYDKWNSLVVILRHRHSATVNQVIVGSFIPTHSEVCSKKFILCDKVCHYLW